MANSKQYPTERDAPHGSHDNASPAAISGPDEAPKEGQTSHGKSGQVPMASGKKKRRRRRRKRSKNLTQRSAQREGADVLSPASSNAAAESSTAAEAPQDATQSQEPGAKVDPAAWDRAKMRELGFSERRINRMYGPDPAPLSPDDHTSRGEAEPIEVAIYRKDQGDGKHKTLSQVMNQNNLSVIEIDGYHVPKWVIVNNATLARHPHDEPFPNEDELHWVNSNEWADEDVVAYLEACMLRPENHRHYFDMETMPAAIEEYKASGVLPELFRTLIGDKIVGAKYKALLRREEEERKRAHERDVTARVKAVCGSDEPVTEQLRTLRELADEGRRTKDNVLARRASSAIRELLDVHTSSWEALGKYAEDQLGALLRRVFGNDPARREALLKGFDERIHAYLDHEPSPTLRILGRKVALLDIEHEVTMGLYYRSAGKANEQILLRKVDSISARLLRTTKQYEQLRELIEKRWERMHPGQPRRKARNRPEVGFDGREVDWALYEESESDEDHSDSGKNVGQSDSGAQKADTG